MAPCVANLADNISEYQSSTDGQGGLEPQLWAPFRSSSQNGAKNGAEKDNSGCALAKKSLSKKARVSSI